MIIQNPLLDIAFLIIVVLMLWISLTKKQKVIEKLKNRIVKFEPQNHYKKVELNTESHQSLNYLINASEFTIYANKEGVFTITEIQEEKR